MKLLIITQAVNLDNPILGFFHRWVEEFAKHYESIIVICLEKGEYNLPKNVQVLSLGKESGKSKIKYLFNFYKYLWQERKNYGGVFVHMDQEYVLLGGIFWRLFGKKIFFWRNHAKGSLRTRFAILFSDKTFCTSSQSFTAKFRKTQIMPVGIDTDFFRPNPFVQKKPCSVLFLGRISPVKKVDIFIEVLNELQKLGVEFSATIAGATLTKDDGYGKMIQDKTSQSGLANKVQFVGLVTPDQALELYREHELYVNLTLSGSLDKTIFEAMACGTIPLVFNQDLKEVLGRELIIPELNLVAIAKRISLILGDKQKSDFRNFVIENHSLEILIDKLMSAFVVNYG